MLFVYQQRSGFGNGEKGTLLTLLCRDFRAHCGRCSLIGRGVLSCRGNLASLSRARDRGCYSIVSRARTIFSSQIAFH